MSSWRSGSTFLGDVFKTHPGTFYHLEPLHYFGLRQIKAEGQIAQESRDLIKSLIQCNFTELGKCLAAWIPIQRDRGSSTSFEASIQLRTNLGPDIICFPLNPLRPRSFFQFQANRSKTTHGGTFFKVKKYFKNN